MTTHSASDRTNDLPIRVALHRVPRMGSARFAMVEAAFGSCEEAWRAGYAELMAAGLDARTAQAVVRAHEEIDPAAEMERLHRANVLALAPDDPRYPSRLGEIGDAPPVLYVRGA